jgi:hypothetical protein
LGTDSEAIRLFVGIDLDWEHESALSPWGVADEVERIKSRHRLLMTVALATVFVARKRLPALQA